MAQVFFITHPEVIIDPTIPVPEWELSEVGKLRTQEFVEKNILPEKVAAIFSSIEKKAEQTANIIAKKFYLTPKLCPELGEIDRSSTGYVPLNEHNYIVREWFNHPTVSIKGWETAERVQKRAVNHLITMIAQFEEDTIVVVSHGGIGAVTLAALLYQDISLRYEQPQLGSYFVFDSKEVKVVEQWQAM